MNVKLKKSNNMLILFIVGSILGFLSFLYVYGFDVLRVQNDDWLMKGGDLSQHYLGWKFYRESNWSFPLGLIENLVYPNKVSIMYTDSIPLFAIIFKIFSPILPRTFQYFGIWGAFCFALQGGISAIIVKKFTNSYILPVLSSLFFIFSPVVLQRMFAHTALAGHWIILLTIAICLYKEFFNTFRKNLLIWTFLLSLAVTIHMYFVPIILAFMVFYFIKDYIETKKMKDSLIIIGTAILFALVTMYMLGAFYGNSDIVQPGLGIYSANINTLFNSRGTSKFLLHLPLATYGQEEGYAYLGLGIFILLVISIVDLLDNFNRRSSLKEKVKNNVDTVLIMILMLIFFIFAISYVVTFNDKTIVRIPLPSFIISILSIFRASGRFMWPIMYTIMILSIKSILKYHTKKPTIIMLWICCLLQLVDLSPFINSKKDYYNQNLEYTSQLTSEAWTELAKNHNQIIFMNEAKNVDSDILHVYYDLQTIFDLANYANNNGMSMNDFYIGRRDSNKITDYRNKHWDKLENGNPEANAIYIFKKIPYQLLVENKINLYEINNLIVGSAYPLNSHEDDIFSSYDINNYIDIQLNSNNFLDNGEDTDVGRILRNNGISYGPYIKLIGGKYRVRITGSKLEQSYFDVCYGGTVVPININFLEENKIEFDFELIDTVENIEFRIMNHQDEEIIIKNICFKRLEDGE
jgi:hypothetical protein|nr:DUF6311 domain-containing protein [uncultured Lachnoclostridium sp.]